ncbi:uncharacterized protein LOC130737817 isoform X1 [Lotus japonicus]|nr:uncharacterized protein LOC130737817 isoform X1 [Lotus japonicus]XP_057445651.1 uncharacterized protein LOC130737817 isoform X1 [Lotus japonicus]XP_057445652.1 uncharacterized protein LOC130737817 isoform X1 [Lotus japonicus]XP_057445653.1 uncharacterized protein LOC130737817 isoform X1 [Lotus japonicus]XP_057445654.1 uncharacterized protein LOC130737817 isoform X1 [Lotus japonicus]
MSSSTPTTCSSLSSSAPAFYVERLIFFEQKKIPAQTSLFISYKLVSLQSPKSYVRRPRIAIYLQVSMQSSLIRSKSGKGKDLSQVVQLLLKRMKRKKRRKRKKKKDDSKK